ncbi:hypothetical protein SALBM311S_00463 [Streptomyces alboniger]
MSKPARFKPGTDWSYSNTNYVLARLLIEKVTGHTFAEEMQRLILGPLGLSDTVVPDTSPEIPEPHTHAYYRYEDSGRQKTVDVTRQNPSWIATGGDMISTTQDLHTFISALMGGKLLPALLAEMCKPHPKVGYGLGVFVQDSGENGGTVITHNGGRGGPRGADVQHARRQQDPDRRAELCRRRRTVHGRGVPEDDAKPRPGSVRRRAGRGG